MESVANVVAQCDKLLQEAQQELQQANLSLTLVTAEKINAMKSRRESTPSLRIKKCWNRMSRRLHVLLLVVISVTVTKKMSQNQLIRGLSLIVGRNAKKINRGHVLGR